VVAVHCKDGDWPPKDSPDALGEERPLGQGSVGMERFIAKLKQIGYQGPLTIEREAQDPIQRRDDILMGAELLRRLSA
jgi:sugar phosphate isomerase/epimerase